MPAAAGTASGVGEIRETIRIGSWGWLGLKWGERQHGIYNTMLSIQKDS